jgi:hypothetical protein
MTCGHTHTHIMHINDVENIRILVLLKVEKILLLKKLDVKKLDVAIFWNGWSNFHSHKRFSRHTRALSVNI